MQKELRETTIETVRQSLQEAVRQGEPPGKEELEQAFLSSHLSTEELITLGESLRERFFQKKVQIHILNNVKNGNCSEDCNYCAQRRGDETDAIPSYTVKEEEEILQEARDAHEAGAFRYCLVLSGKGPTPGNIDFFGRIVRRLKGEFPGMEICLSAGILTNPEQAEFLKQAGLDRYNHNLNTSIAHYDDICTTHHFSDRVDTLTTMSGAGISLCSGVIVGMGEEPRDLVEVACQLRENRVASIPVNFFIPIPGHKIQESPLTTDFCLRVLALFRLANPDAEIRMAAGRELYLESRQGEGLRVANSLFVSGYLNVQGSDLNQTLHMIREAGYEVDYRRSEIQSEEREGGEAEASDTRDAKKSNESPVPDTSPLRMKELSDLRPYRSER